MLNLRRCQSFIDIPKSTVIAMLPEKSRIRKQIPTAILVVIRNDILPLHNQEI